ncbi:hypothetical protein BDZ45DRAFT_707269 [Acephala macrosclerotiorum]|nr:hypothetical protein BDZ45DRAFT_707269 [Acephala macrosclerotiorum]
MLKGSGAKVRYIGHNQLIKMQCHPTEFEAMEFVRQNTTIPIPKVFGAYNRIDGSQDLVMELVPGHTLNVTWQTLTPEQKTSLVTELAGYLERLRGLQPPKEGFVGSSMLGSGYDHRLGCRRFGPFESIADFHKFVRRGDSMDLWAFDKDVTNNIMVVNEKITGIIDWEFAGWFPEYWEYTKMYFGWRPYRADFYYEMDKVLTTYPQELAADKATLKEYDIWSYDIDRPRRATYIHKAPRD